jgi:hypothetical protein
MPAFPFNPETFWQRFLSTLRAWAPWGLIGIGMALLIALGGRQGALQSRLGPNANLAKLVLLYLTGVISVAVIESALAPFRRTLLHYLLLRIASLLPFAALVVWLLLGYRGRIALEGALFGAMLLGTGYGMIDWQYRDRRASDA